MSEPSVLILLHETLADEVNYLAHIFYDQTFIYFRIQYALIVGMVRVESMKPMLGITALSHGRGTSIAYMYSPMEMYVKAQSSSLRVRLVSHALSISTLTLRALSMSISFERESVVIME